MSKEENMVGWFEIPVTDMQRAKEFYEAAFDIKIEVHQMGELEMGWFPFVSEGSGAGGSLVRHEEFYHPSPTHGTLVYISCPDVKDSLELIVKAGGKVVQEKKLIAEGYGYMGLFIDSEGNRVALHSRN